jgi:hypothetical protein
VERDDTDERFCLVSGVTEEGFAFDGSTTFNADTAVDAEPDQIALEVKDTKGVYDMLIERRGDTCVRIATHNGVEVDSAVGNSVYALLPTCISKSDWLRRGPFFANRDIPSDMI